jgi:hypothetical protein
MASFQHSIDASDSSNCSFLSASSPFPLAASVERMAQFGPGNPFSMLTRRSLQHPNKAALSTPLLRIDNFVEFQSAFLRMNEARQSICHDCCLMLSVS